MKTAPYELSQNLLLIPIPIFQLVVIETLGRWQLHPELCPHPKDCQDYAHNGHEECQLDLVTEQNAKTFQSQRVKKYFKSLQFWIWELVKTLLLLSATCIYLYSSPLLCRPSYNVLTYWLSLALALSTLSLCNAVELAIYPAHVLSHVSCISALG